MKQVQIVFSPTGGTAKVAQVLTKAWGTPVETVDLTDASADFSAVSLSAEDLAWIAVPSFGGRVPELTLERLAAVRGNGARCVLVCVYGNRAYEDTLVELQDAAEQCGFRVLAAIAAVAEHSILRQYATGRPDSQDCQVLQSYVEAIRAKWDQAADASPAIPGNRPYKKRGGAGMVPEAGKGCVNCGLCARRCPAQAIDGANVRKADAKKCISCMRCVAECPVSARKVNGAMLGMAALALKKVCSERKECELFI